MQIRAPSLSNLDYRGDMLVKPRPTLNGCQPPGDLHTPDITFVKWTTNTKSTRARESRLGRSSRSICVCPQAPLPPAPAFPTSLPPLTPTPRPSVYNVWKRDRVALRRAPARQVIGFGKPACATFTSGAYGWSLGNW